MHASYSKLSKELKNGIEILVGQEVFKLWIKTVEILFWSITQELLDLLKGRVNPATISKPEFCNFFTILNMHMYPIITNIYEGGLKIPCNNLFLFTWVHLYKGGSIYIKYEPLSFMSCNMNSFARLVALRH